MVNSISLTDQTNLNITTELIKLAELNKIPISPTNIIYPNIKTLTIKEDGATLYLIKINDNWNVYFKHSQQNDLLPFDNTMTFTELFFSIINCDINMFAEKLQIQLSNNNITYFVLEMCSPKIRNIKIYESDQLYLINAYDKFFNRIDIININSTQLRPTNIKCLTFLEFKEPFTYQHFLDCLINLTSKDLSMEGIVIEYANSTDSTNPINSTIHKCKILNPYYVIQHVLKYNGWSYATPQLIVPLILEKKDHDVIHNVKQCINGDNLFSFQIGEICEFYNTKIEHEYNCMVIAINDLIEQKKNLKGQLSSKQLKDKYMCYIAMMYPSIYEKWKDFFEEIYDDLNNIRNKKCLPLNEAFKKYLLINLDKVFLKTDYSIDQSHPPNFCDKINISVEEIKEDYTNDGKSLKKTHCYCGSKMIIKKISGCLTRYKFCHCDKIFNYEIFPDGSYVAVCSDESCSCVQKVDQNSKEILGMPCSVLCYTLRNNLIELYDKLNILNSDQILKIHNMGINECLKKLESFD